VKIRAVAVPSPTHLEITGDCYAIAANYILDSKEPQIYLIHGRPTLQVLPYCQFGHAWLEIGEVCIDGNNLIQVPKQLYYAMGQIHEDLCLRYTKEQVRTYVLKFKHYGPWEGVVGTPPIEDNDDE